MKHLKIFACAVLAATALMTYASSASATVLTSPSGTEYTGTFTATAVETLTMKAGAFTKTCTESTISGTVLQNTTVAGIAISTLSYSGCTVTVDVLSKGSLEVKSGGEVRITGDEVTTSALGTSCVYGGGTGTKLGTLTGGTTATLTISALLPKISGGFACANPGTYTGKYAVTTPDTLIVD